MLALGHGLTAAQLTARVAHQVPSGDAARARETDWGAWFVSGTHLERAGWLVVGRPTTSCWGVPKDGLVDLDAVVGDLVRFGAGAAATFAGPLVAVELSTGAWSCSLSGLAALGRPIDDHRLETTAAATRSIPVHVAVVSDSSPGFRVERLVEEIAHHVGPTTAAPALTDPTDTVSMTVAGHDWSGAVRSVEGGLVLDPPNLRDVLVSSELMALARSCVAPRLAWRAERIGRVLHAPFLERPVLDQVGFAAAGSQFAGTSR